MANISESSKFVVVERANRVVIKETLPRWIT